MKRQRDGLYSRGKMWWMSYIVGRRRVRESTGYADRRAAELVLAKVRVGIKEGKWFGRSEEVRTPLAQAIEEFLTLYSRSRKVSWNEDEQMLRRFSEYLRGEAVLQEVDRLAVERFLRKLLAEGLSPARVNRYIATLKCFWNRQIDWGKATTNPIKGIKLYPETMRTEYLELGQIRALLAACTPRLRPIVYVALLTGLRKGDILNLRWEAINLSRRQISLLQGKTRTPLTLHMSEALARLLAGIPQNPDSPYVFHQGRKPLKPFGWVRGDYLAAAKAAGLPEQKRRFHTLRHTVATQLRFLGKDLAVIKEQLGHKSLRMTLRYAHVAPEELKRAADQLGEKLTEGIPEADELVTNKSQSPIVPPAPKSAVMRNESSLQDEMKTVVRQDDQTPRTVNVTGARRDGEEGDGFRRADVGGPEPE